MREWQQGLGLTDPATPPRSLYVHIPFCFHKCHYCDFYSIVDQQDRQDAFTDRLIQELSAIAPFTRAAPLRSIFIGGGTPTLLKPDLLSKVLKHIASVFQIDASTEWTIEVNPETMDERVADVLADSSVNRVSMGAQSFNTKHLKTLERHHNPDSVARALELAQSREITRRSIDLIYGIPGQTIDEWDSDLSTAFTLPIEHLSAYALTYEPNTAMTARLERGDFDPTPDDTEVEMYNLSIDRVRAHGFERYEVSNHASDNGECFHNLAYWRSEDWLAAGPSASGHLGGYRWKNTPRLDTYLKSSDSGFAPMSECERPDPTRRLQDALMMGIRTREGLDAQRVLRDADALGSSTQLNAAAQICVDQGWINLTQDRWTLTESGYHFADRVAREFILAVSREEPGPI